MPIQIPALVPHFYRYLENPPFSFAEFRGTPPRDIPLDAYMELLRWVRRVFVEFRELELRLLLGDVRASLFRGASLRLSSVAPALRLGDQEVAEHLHAGD